MIAFLAFLAVGAAALSAGGGPWARASRVLAAALAALMVADPTIETSLDRSTPAETLVLLDRSGSMAIRDEPSGRRRSESADSAVAKLLSEPGQRSFRVLEFDQPTGTDLARVLAIHGRSAPTTEAVILVSDGASTRGDPPERIAAQLAGAHGLAIHCIRVGSSSGPPDRRIISARLPETARSNEAIPVEIELGEAGVAAVPAELSIHEGQRELARLDVAAHTRHLRMSVPALPEGPHVLEVRVSVAPGEVITENNILHRGIIVDPEPISVRVLAGRPSPDLAALLRCLARDPGLTVTAITQTGPRRFIQEAPGTNPPQPVPPLALPAPPDWGDSEAIFLVDVDNVAVGEGAIDQLRQGLSAGRWGVAMFGQEKLPWATSLGPPLNIVARGSQSRPTTALFEPNRHPILTDLNLDHLEQLPPLSAPPITTAIDGAQILASANTGPLLATIERGSDRLLSAVLPGAWRWLVENDRGLGPDRPVEQLWGAATRWLAGRLGSDKLIVSTKHPVITPLDSVQVEAQLDLVSGPPRLLSAKISDHEGATVDRLSLEHVGAGRWYGARGALPPGIYKIAVNSGAYGDESQLIVQSIQPELVDPRAHPSTLARIAGASGGVVVPPDSLAALQNILPQGRRSRTELLHLRPGRSTWTLVLTLLLLGVDWTLRRRQGLP